MNNNVAGLDIVKSIFHLFYLSMDGKPVNSSTLSHCQRGHWRKIATIEEVKSLLFVAEHRFL
jgi:hypothetical protein